MTASNRTGRRKRAALRTRKTARQGSRPTRRGGRRAAPLSTSPAADPAAEAAASHDASWQLVRLEPGSPLAATTEPPLEPVSSDAHAAALGYLASGIAHALQARLGLMETIAEGLDATVASDDWEVRRSLGNLRRCLLRSHALVDQLLHTGGRASPRLLVQ